MVNHWDIVAEMVSGERHQLSRVERMEAILERDGPQCVWCGRLFDSRLNPPTTDHLVPRIKGGPSWMENEIAACRRCNGERGHQSPAGFFVDCSGLGRTPNKEVLIRTLESLQVAIRERGGQRRCRPYVASQLRRLSRM